MKLPFVNEIMKKCIACFNLLHPCDVTFSDESFIFILHDFSFSAIFKFFEVFLKRKMLTSDCIICSGGCT